MTESASGKIAKRIRQRTTFWRRFLTSGCASLVRPPFPERDLAQLRSFCLFVGYPRSGSTLVAAMLNAHPDVLLGHELDAVGFVRWHCRRNQLFHAIRSSVDEFEQAGSRWEGYDYEIAGAAGYRRLLVIGDKEASLSAVRIGGDASLVGGMAETVGVPLKLVHVVRNPFDNIATMYLRGRYPILRLPLSACIAKFGKMVQTIESLKREVASDDFFELHFEDVVERPKDVLEALCAFFELDTPREYVDAATAIVKAPKVARDCVAWAENDVRAVEEIIAGSSAHHVYDGSRPTRIYPPASRRRAQPRHGPDFLVVGAQRAGTTLMHRLLALHPEIYVPTQRKEIHFFDVHYSRGESWYREFFPIDRHGFSALGEVTPSYLPDPLAPERIRNFYPEMRLIALLRDPVARIWSAYHHLRRISGESRPFSTFIRDDRDAVERGSYAVQLARYTEFFPREQMLVLLFEEFVSSPAAELEKVREHLGLHAEWDSELVAGVERENPSFVVRYPALYRLLRGAGSSATDHFGLGETVARVKRSRAMSVFDAGEAEGGMTQDDRSYLEHYYASDAARLGQDFGVETAVWQWTRTTPEPLPSTRA